MEKPREQDFNDMRKSTGMYEQELHRREQTDLRIERQWCVR